MSTLYTIGFTGKSAKDFFTIIQNNNIKRLIDVRLNNNSQLAGYTKKNDLTFFLKEICHIPYTHLVEFAPTKEILNNYRKEQISWQTYEILYNKLLISRQKKIEQVVNLDSLDSACLLCSEKEATHCHRRLAAEFLQNLFSSKIEKIIHI